MWRIIIYTRSINKYLTKYSTYNEKLNPNWVTGFCDAESCFQLVIYKNPKVRSGWSVRLVFSIHLHVKEVDVLYKIQKFFLVGNVTIHKDAANFQVVSLTDLLRVMEHFNSYPLRSQKHSDFILFKKAYDLIANKEHLLDMKNLVNIRASMNKGLPERLLLEFPNANPEVRPEFTLDKNDKLFDINYWIAGFVDGEGCFYVKTSKSKTHKLGLSVTLNFIVTQNIRDMLLMEEIKSTLGCGSITINESSSVIRFAVTKLSDIQNKIIPFFDKYSLVGDKLINYEDFKRVSDLMARKSHLTKEGLDEILAIKSNMNFNRK